MAINYHLRLNSEGLRTRVAAEKSLNFHLLFVLELISGRIEAKVFKYFRYVCKIPNIYYFRWIFSNNLPTSCSSLNGLLFTLISDIDRVPL